MTKPFQMAMLLVAGFLFASLASADTIIDLSTLDSDTDLSAEIDDLFGTSGVWTTTDNMAALEDLAVLIAGGQIDESQVPAILQPLLQIILEEEYPSGTVSLDAQSDSGPDQPVSDGPEPATLVLLGGGLVFLGLYALRSYGARQLTRQSDSDRLHSEE